MHHFTSHKGPFKLHDPLVSNSPFPKRFTIDTPILFIDYSKETLDHLFWGKSRRYASIKNSNKGAKKGGYHKRHVSKDTYWKG